MASKTLHTNLLGHMVKPQWLNHLRPPEPMAWFRPKDGQNNVIPYPETATIHGVWVEDKKIKVLLVDEHGRSIEGWLEHYLLLPVPPLPTT